jgi:8-oxo-dGTP diphosphatase
VTDVRALATDAVVVLDGEVLLMERDHEPHRGTWVLPGGVVEPDETAREACVREAEEEVGLDVETTDFAGLYDDSDRDPRGNVSAAYRCEPTDDDPEPEPSEEASALEAFPPEDLPEMGFDHAEIVADAF